MSTLTASLTLLGNSSGSFEAVSKFADKAAATVKKAYGEVDTFNRKLNSTAEQAKSAFGGFGKFFDMEKVKRGMEIADNYVRLQTRLKAVNNELGTQAELQNNVFAAANRSRSSYSDMVNTFADLASAAGDTFGSNNEILSFTELTQKSLKLGGTDAKTQSAGMDQVIGAMGSGTIQEGDFDTITSTAPMMLKAMEDFTGKSADGLRKMAEQGTLTADILKKSMFAASANINDAFFNMPMTFNDIWQRIKNAALQAFGGVIEGVSKIINSGGFQKFLAVIITGIYTVGNVLNWIVGILDYIAPILETIGGVLLAAMIANLWVVATAAWTAAAAFIVANWTIICIVAVIVIVINLLGKLGVSLQDIFSFVGGAIGVFTTWLENIPVAISNIGVWIDKFISGLFNGIIDGINKVVSVINKITGSDIKILDYYQGKTEGKEYKELKSYSDAYKKGAQKGSDNYTNMNNKLGGMTEGFDATAFTGIPSKDDLGTPNNPISVQGTGANGNLAVDMAEEDIQYLRDIAERDYINKFSTATVAPNIQVSFGDIHQEADADKVAGRIQRILREQIATAGEGV